MVTVTVICPLLFINSISEVYMQTSHIVFAEDVYIRTNLTTGGPSGCPCMQLDLNAWSDKQLLYILQLNSVKCKYIHDYNQEKASHQQLH